MERLGIKEGVLEQHKEERDGDRKRNKVRVTERDFGRNVDMG